MTYHERRSVVDLLASFTTAGAYLLYLWGRYREGGAAFLADNRSWALSFLVFIGVSIALNVLITIMFVVVYAIASKDEIPKVRDERDEVIELSSYYACSWFFVGSVILGIVTQAFDMGIWLMYFLPFIGGLLSGIIKSLLTFVKYRRGV